MKVLYCLLARAYARARMCVCVCFMALPLRNQNKSLFRNQIYFRVPKHRPNTLCLVCLLLRQLVIPPPTHTHPTRLLLLPSVVVWATAPLQPALAEQRCMFGSLTSLSSCRTSLRFACREPKPVTNELLVLRWTYVSSGSSERFKCTVEGRVT